MPIKRLGVTTRYSLKKTGLPALITAKWTVINGYWARQPNNHLAALRLNAYARAFGHLLNQCHCVNFSNTVLLTAFAY